MLYRNANEALLGLSANVLNNGSVVNSRAGQTKELLFQRFTIKDPLDRYITIPGRKVSVAAQIAETMWVLAGRSDVEWLGHYLPRAKDFSDDGETWRAGYGPRIRKWDAGMYVNDQLGNVVQALRDDPNTRRAVISLWDPASDYCETKDVPCNNWLHFLARAGRLHLHVATRSNDLMWGWSGINNFEWSVLLEIVAKLTNLSVGQIHYSVSSLHLYERHFAKARAFGLPAPAASRPPAFEPESKTVSCLDSLLDEWFSIEEAIRTGAPGAPLLITPFPEPMMREWLRVLHNYWTGIEARTCAGPDFWTSAVWRAAELAPKRAKTLTEKVSEAWENAPKGLTIESMADKVFHDYVCKLHDEKHVAYGDSWKRRGEMLGILANIARKVDRLGVDGAGDTSADTAIDLMVYLAKYRWWLHEQGAPIPLPYSVWVGIENASNITTPANDLIRAQRPWEFGGEEKALVRDFDHLEMAVNEALPTRYRIVDEMLTKAHTLAMRTWYREREAWKADNAKRSWNPES
jgi:thymidylate synthase